MDIALTTIAFIGIVIGIAYLLDKLAFGSRHSDYRDYATSTTSTNRWVSYELELEPERKRVKYHPSMNGKRWRK